MKNSTHFYRFYIILQEDLHFARGFVCIYEQVSNELCSQNEGTIRKEGLFT